ncbi:hypothetical protein DBV15_02569 [Temnothorax longispinosus]|uniref:Uncharacterized protein n=1 Tax=Temnothorax longispinosus TaxID=300112 RepID=A0A4S2KGC0_9HYME|nr:hypothetical protein DBV15_02569 [Temnothorax longispinosus]
MDNKITFLSYCQQHGFIFIKLSSELCMPLVRIGPPVARWVHFRAGTGERDTLVGGNEKDGEGEEDEGGWLIQG